MRESTIEGKHPQISHTPSATYSSMWTATSIFSVFKAGLPGRTSASFQSHYYCHLQVRNFLFWTLTRASQEFRMGYPWRSWLCQVTSFVRSASFSTLACAMEDRPAWTHSGPALWLPDEVSLWASRRDHRQGEEPLPFSPSWAGATTSPITEPLQVALSAHLSFWFLGS